MKSRFLALFLILYAQVCFGVELDALKSAFSEKQTPFDYPIQINIVPGNTLNEPIIISAHGFGGNNSIVDVIKSYQVPYHLIGFNFPDHDIMTRNISPNKITFGTIKELMPLIYILKKLVVDAKAEEISLYGFSAGGAAVINTIAVLNSNQFDNELLKIGVDEALKIKILTAIQKGTILLDAPLKSMEEINAGRKYNATSQAMATNYFNNKLRPIDSLESWQGLNLNVILFFQNPDSSVSNRDDQIFIDRLLKYNAKGKNITLVKDEGGHLGYHRSLWKAFLGF